MLFGSPNFAVLLLVFPLYVSISFTFTLFFLGFLGGAELIDTWPLFFSDREAKWPICSCCIIVLTV